MCYTHNSIDFFRLSAVAELVYDYLELQDGAREVERCSNKLLYSNWPVQLQRRPVVLATVLAQGAQQTREAKHLMATSYHMHTALLVTYCTGIYWAMESHVISM